ncbi:MAG TPA: recombinase family protein [Pyrinomonadaceae bacterium]|jgi:site-specific DNA recombinase
MRQQNTTKINPAALIYCRVSTEKQEQEGTSLDSQADACIEYAKQNGYQIAEVVKETFSGAYLFDRPKLNEQRAKIRAGEYGAVVVYAIDRLSRDVAHLAILVDEIERHGAKLHFVTENLDQTAEGKLLLSVRSYVAEVERQKIRERSTRGKTAKLKAGTLFRSSKDMYGYAFDKETGKRSIKPQEAEIIRQIFNCAFDGMSMKAIAKRLNENNVESPAANKNYRNLEHFAGLRLNGRTLWQISSIRRLLTEPAYKGVTIGNRTKLVTTFENGERKTRQIKRDETELIYLPAGTTPAIIAPALFDAVQEKIKNNHGEKIKNAKGRYYFLLRGLAFCSSCGRKMYPEINGQKTPIYRCSSRDMFMKCTEGGYVSAPAIEAALWEILCLALKEPEKVLAEHQKRRANADNGRQAIQCEIDNALIQLSKLETEITNLVKRAATVDDDLWAVFQEQIRIKKNEQARFNDSIEELQGKLEACNLELGGIEALRAYSQAVGNPDNLTNDQKRLLLEQLDIKLIGNKNGYRFDMAAIGGVEFMGLETLNQDQRNPSANV